MYSKRFKFYYYIMEEIDMLSIDEAITLERQIAKDQIDRMPSFEHEQIANWLEELKELKENSISKEAFEKMKSKSYQYGYRKGHGDAINKVLKLPKYTIYDTSNEFMNIRIDAISIEDILKLKEQNK